MVFILENKRYLTEQIITYLGNKRLLMPQIVEALSPYLQKKIIFLDLFSGSGIASRYFKQFSKKIIANDLEEYSKVINESFLTNASSFNKKECCEILSELDYLTENKPIEGIISNNYAPKDEAHITSIDRVFYTIENARRIDSYRHYIEEIVPDIYKKYFLASLITEASVHVNTSGVFKGFYKDRHTGLGKYGGSAQNALSRIRGKIQLKLPVLSNYECSSNIYKSDAASLVQQLSPVDLAYLDPPYNQHPYGSNYFMLNLILKNQTPPSISRVSGIPTDWNRSKYNVKKQALCEIKNVVTNLPAKVIAISYNNEGFVSFDEMYEMLLEHGKVKSIVMKYHTFRGARNLINRPIFTNEYLFILEKRGW